MDLVNIKAICRLSRNHVKIIAMTVMILDHIAIAFFDNNSVDYQIIRGLGRISGPLFAYFLVEGFIYTSNIKKYTYRLGIGALISQIPYSLFEYVTTDTKLLSENGVFALFPWFSVFYTLFLSLIFLRVYTSVNIKNKTKIFLLILITIFTCLGDWGIYYILFVYIFWNFRKNTKIMWVLFCIVGLTYVAYIKRLFGIGIFITPIVIQLYSAEKGSSHPFWKWFFYVIYPVHLVILAVIVFTLK